MDKNGDGVLQYVMLEGEPGHQDTLLRTEYSVQILTEGGLTVEKLASNTANWDRSQCKDEPMDAGIAYVARGCNIQQR